MTRRILVIEDHPDTQDALVQVLALWGFVVEGATGGAEGIVKAAWFRPDVAIVDLVMPDVDGFAVAEELRSLLPDRPFLIADQMRVVLASANVASRRA